MDMVAHEVGHLRDTEGNLFPLDMVAPVAKGRVWSLFHDSGCGSFRGFLTKGKHYRHRLATMLPYKGHREDLARNNVDDIKDIFHKDFDAIYCTDWEADDAIATEQWQDLLTVGSEHGWDDGQLRKHANTVIASRDKDLDTVPGWHYKWKTKAQLDREREESGLTEEELLLHATPDKGTVYWVTVLESFQNFYKQMITGDSADNIKGLFGRGEKSDWVKQLNDMDNEQDMYDHVEDKYRKYYGNYADRFLKEVGRLLHMCRYKGDTWLPPHERDEHYWFL